MNENQLRRYLSVSLCTKYKVCGSDKVKPPLLINEINIVNTDLDNQEGTHWIVFYCNKQNQLVYFDSVGECSFKYGHFKKLQKYYGNNIISNKGFPLQHMLLYSDTCGMMCCYVAHFLCRGKTLNSIMNEFKLAKTIKETNENECKIKSFMELYYSQFSSMFKNLTGCYQNDVVVS